MKNANLLLSLPAAILIVVLCAVVLIAGGAAAVVLWGKYSKKPKNKSGGVFDGEAKKSKISDKSGEEKSVKSEPEKIKAEEKKEPPQQPQPVKKQEKAEVVKTEIKPQPETVKREVKPQVKAVETEPQPQPETKPVSEEKQPPKEKIAESKKVEVFKSEQGQAFVKIRYNRSFTARLIQADEKVKEYYSAVKNELKQYDVKERTSWRYETYRRGRKLLAKLCVRGKTLCLYCAGDAGKYGGTSVKAEDVSAKKSQAQTPLLYRIKNPRRLKYSAQIIEDVMTAHGLERKQTDPVDYAGNYPYEELEALIDKKLVKLLSLKDNSGESEVGVLPVSEMLPKEVLEEVSVAEAESILPGDDVETLIGEGELYSDKTKKGIVNIDTLSKYFSSGETVTLDEIKKRIPEVSKKTTYIKILARGALDKSLTVEADDFSPSAVKMIVLTGGKALRTKMRRN